MNPDQQPSNLEPQSAPQPQPYQPQQSENRAPEAPQSADRPPVTYQQATTENPGKTLGIISLVLSFIFGLGLFGLITGIIGLNKSKKAHMKNGLALAGIIISVVNMLITAGVITAFVYAGSMGIDALKQCEANPSGTYTIAGQTESCASINSEMKSY